MEQATLIAQWPSSLGSNGCVLCVLCVPIPVRPRDPLSSSQLGRSGLSSASALTPKSASIWKYSLDATSFLSWSELHLLLLLLLVFTTQSHWSLYVRVQTKYTIHHTKVIRDLTQMFYGNNLYILYLQMPLAIAHLPKQH